MAIFKEGQRVFRTSNTSSVYAPYIIKQVNADGSVFLHDDIAVMHRYGPDGLLIGYNPYGERIIPESKHILDEIARLELADYLATVVDWEHMPLEFIHPILLIVKQFEAAEDDLLLSSTRIIEQNEKEETGTSSIGGRNL
jgi:hypothetical protein